MTICLPLGSLVPSFMLPISKEEIWTDNDGWSSPEPPTPSDSDTLWSEFSGLDDYDEDGYDSSEIIDRPRRGHPVGLSARASSRAPHPPHNQRHEARQLQAPQPGRGHLMSRSMVNVSSLPSARPQHPYGSPASQRQQQQQQQQQRANPRDQTAALATTSMATARSNQLSYRTNPPPPASYNPWWTSKQTPSLPSEESSRSGAYEDGRPPQQLLSWEYKSGRTITVKSDPGQLGTWRGKKACLLRVHVHAMAAEKMERLWVRLSFAPEHGPPGSRGPVKIFFLGPEQLYGRPTREQRLTAVGGGAHVAGGLPGVAGAGAGVQGGRATARELVHRRSLHGWSDCEDNISRATWEASEDERARKGVPSDLVLVAVVQYKSDKGLRVWAEAKAAPCKPFARKPEPRPYTVRPDGGHTDFSCWGDREWKATGMTVTLESR